MLRRDSNVPRFLQSYSDRYEISEDTTLREFLFSILSSYGTKGSKMVSEDTLRREFSTPSSRDTDAAGRVERGEEDVFDTHAEAAHLVAAETGRLQVHFRVSAAASTHRSLTMLPHFASVSLDAVRRGAGLPITTPRRVATHRTALAARSVLGRRTVVNEAPN